MCILAEVLRISLCLTSLADCNSLKNGTAVVTTTVTASTTTTIPTDVPATTSSAGGSRPSGFSVVAVYNPHHIGGEADVNIARWKLWASFQYAGPMRIYAGAQTPSSSPLVRTSRGR